MHRTAPGRHRSPELTLAATAAANPEWAPWLRLLERAQSATAPPWVIEIGLVPERGDAPLLDQAIIAVDTARLAAWTSDLLAAAAEEQPSTIGTTPIGRAEAIALLEAAIALDTDRLDDLAERRGEDAHRLAATMQLVAMPVLLAARARLAAEVPRGWGRGYCPVCGAWPAFAEVRGLERQRRARCGRCACDWRFDALHCPYCDERDHGQLTGLVVEGEEETRRVDTCKQCNGYLKALATLMAVPDEQVPIVDLESVELDLVATERGFARPDAPAVVMRVAVHDRDAIATNSDGRKWLLS
jgi:FdhE protein